MYINVNNGTPSVNDLPEDSIIFIGSLPKDYFLVFWLEKNSSQSKMAKPYLIKQAIVQEKQIDKGSKCRYPIKNGKAISILNKSLTVFSFLIDEDDAWLGNKKIEKIYYKKPDLLLEIMGD